jgi:AcrR family transcriptional regulator
VPLRLGAETLDSARREGGHVVEMQRRRLLRAFAEVLAEDGLEEASIGRVCKRAGVSRRTFYYLFDDREACFVAVLDEAVERISHSVLLAYGHGGRWSERMRAALAALLEFFDAEPALASTCLIETLKAGPAVIERRRRVVDALSAAVDQGRAEVKRGAGPPPLTADSTVGGALSVIHAHVLACQPATSPSDTPFRAPSATGRPRTGERGSRLVELLNPLMSMIVHPYLGPVAARRELDRPIPQATPVRNGRVPRPIQDPFKDLPLRITFRTARVLATIAAQPGASNREVGDAAGVPDQGQISKLLRRLAGYGLIENHGEGHPKGEPNAWTLTARGQAIYCAIGLPMA